MAKLLKRGERIPARDYNAIVKEVLMVNSGGDPPRGDFPLYGECADDVEAYGLLEIDNSASTTPGRDDIPEVEVRAWTDGGSTVFCTNGPEPLVADQSAFLRLIPFHQPVLLRCDATNTPTQGNECGPDPDTTHDALDSRGSGFMCITPPFEKTLASGDVDVCWATRLPGSGSSSTKIFKTPGGGISALSGSTPGTASCTEYKIDTGSLATNTDTEDVLNIWPFDIPGDMYIVAHQEAITNEWVAMHPGIVDVQWNDPNLQQTYDGTTLETIDTAEDCT